MQTESFHWLIRQPALAVVARVLLTLPFWTNGLMRLWDFEGSAAELAKLGFVPGAAFNMLIIVSNLLGAGLVIARRWTWLGAGMLGVFTALTVVLVHRFWALQGVDAVRALHTAQEHLGVIGGLALAVILAAHPLEGRP